MNLPSFLWLWQIAAWSMGLSWLAFLILAVSGGWMWWRRRSHQPRPDWLRPFHYCVGATLAILVLILLTIGIIGTLGHYGSLGHSIHLYAGLAVVALVFLSAWSAMQIQPARPWARRLHAGTNAVLLLGFLAVSVTGWQVVRKYLP
ncbi:DUF4079 domain-containing protein [Leptodesmis sp.]|uniref:DUF4079 domain-containing protein n=1 Tax=Leptodesmis sp. TaxID=3100501 RepID=UPI004053584F